MSFKAIGIIVITLLVLGVIGGAIYKIVQSTETYKAKEQTYNSPEYNFMPLSFGCAHWGAYGQKAKEK